MLRTKRITVLVTQDEFDRIAAQARYATANTPMSVSSYLRLLALEDVELRELANAESKDAQLAAAAYALLGDD